MRGSIRREQLEDAEANTSDSDSKGEGGPTEASSIRIADIDSSDSNESSDCSASSGSDCSVSGHKTSSCRV